MADPERSPRSGWWICGAVSVLWAACALLPACGGGFDPLDHPDGDAPDGGANSGGDDGGGDAPSDDDSATGVADDDVDSDDDTGTPSGDDDTAVSGGDDDTGPDCSPGPGSGDPDDCYDGVSEFLSTVQGAVTGYIDAHPDLFDESSGSPYALDPELYMQGVVDRVNAAGLCCIRDPNAGDEVAVKYDNAFAESFDVLTWDGYARWGDGIYTATCAPAWF